MARVIAHEFGHNFDLYHSGVTSCPIAAGNSMHVSLRVSDCTDQSTFGGWGTLDPISLMGYVSPAMNHLNAYQRTTLGFDPQANVFTPSTPGTYTLSPGAPALPSGNQLVEVSRPNTSPMYDDALYAEYIQSDGVFDTFAPSSKWVNGITFYVAPAGADETQGNGWEALMVDGFPVTDPGYSGDVDPLPVGYSLYDPGSDNVYTTVSAGGATAQFDFRAAPTAGNRPTVSISGTQILYQAGTSQHNSVYVVEQGSDLVITDNAAPVDAGSGCTAIGTQSVKCPISGITGVKFSLGDMDDTFEDYTVVSGVTKTVDPGAGKDILNSQNNPCKVDYSGRSAAVNVSLDGIANDGETGEGDNVLGQCIDIAGGSGDDTLTGNDANNVINPGLGTDTVDGGSAGNDTADYSTRTSGVTINLNGSANSGAAGESDTLTNLDSALGGSGNDVILSKPTYAHTSAALQGGDGADTITVTGPYGTTIRGGAGNDVLTGKTGIDPIYGDDGNDTLDGGSGAPGDYLTGGVGNDTLNYSSRTVNITFNMASGVSGTGESDTLNGDIENAIGGSGNDTFNGTGADNTFTGGDGTDSYTGGTGSDTVSFAPAVNPATATVAGSATDGSAANNTETMPADVENLTGGPIGDSLTGDATANALDGGDGADILTGGPSIEDPLMNGPNALDGGNGNDTLKATGYEVLVAESGEDTYQGIGQYGATVDYSARTGAINASLDGVNNDGDIASSEHDSLSGNLYVNGGSGDDTMIGNGSVNAFEGNGGNDTFDGGASLDNINGGDGNDTFDGGAGSDYLNGGSGTDTFSVASRSTNFTATLNGANSDNEGNFGFENLTGGGGNDTLTGDGNANVIAGGDGNDTLQGLAGNDTLTGGNGADTVSYSQATAGVTVSLATTSAQNTVGAGTDTITSTENLSGSDYNDVLTGNTGNNTITGLLGVDTVSAGSGSDSIQIRDGVNDNPTTCGWGTDTVTADLSPNDAIASGGACETVNRG